MPEIKTPYGDTVFCATQEQADTTLKVLHARHAFALQYSQQKGWDFDDLSIEQILEIRKQPEWASPEKLVLHVESEGSA